MWPKTGIHNSMVEKINNQLHLISYKVPPPHSYSTGTYVHVPSSMKRGVPDPPISNLIVVHQIKTQKIVLTGFHSMYASFLVYIPDMLHEMTEVSVPDPPIGILVVVHHQLGLQGCEIQHSVTADGKST